MFTQHMKPTFFSMLNNTLSTRANSAPGPSIRQLVHHKQRLQQDFFIEYPCILEEHHPHLSCTPDLAITHYIYSKESITHVLKEHQNNYTKDNASYRLIKYLFGDSILTTEGPYWRQCKKIVAPAFSKHHLPEYLSRMQVNVQVMANHWLRLAEDNRFANATLDSSAIALVNAAATQLNIQFNESVIQFIKQVNIVNHFISQYSFPWKPTRRCIKFHLAKRRIKSCLDKIIEQCQTMTASPTNIYHLLKNQHDGKIKLCTEQAIIDNVKTLLISGYETTATLLHWCFYLLARHPGVQDALYTEIKTDIGDTSFSYDMLQRMPLLDAVICETLRLYPPIWQTTRRAQEEDRLCGYTVPQHSMVIIHYYAMHRSARHWTNPNCFMPERFISEHNHASAIKKTSFMPFGIGSHQCLASQFALAESKLIIATVIQKMRVHYCANLPIKPMPLITLQPDRPLYLRIEPR